MATNTRSASLLLRLTMVITIVPHLQLFSLAAAAPPRSNETRDGGGGGKTLSFTLYQQETINKTGYMVVDGVAGAGVSQTTTPFGTVYVFRDNLTVHADGASAVAGVAEGTSITTSLDGLMSLSLAKITIHHRGHRGSVSVLGGTHNTRPSDNPVVGGTGDFAYALGYVRSSPVDLRGSTVTYKMELQLYWPPYAPYAPTPQ
ncbi:dirigent protein 23 [Aegilops tauschii subsp. strangulata]|nr:dirigent protein 9 [Aegilops tauschii subsp. strangulata]XP_044378075.1 dirigent protein 9-like [Triticum aestivum]